MKRIQFPFTALAGQEDMKSALILNAVDASVGGVLISGEKGAGKSTAARGIAALLPPVDVVPDCPYQCDPHDVEALCDQCRRRLDCEGRLPVKSAPAPFVELPLGATEERITGTLHIEEALLSGRRKFEPGLLAAAHRGVLYVDEVNLLQDHLVDVLLDVAASGVNVVEREGISTSHPSRFMLIGTMNPEEGNLRPQFLDRFGLCVLVETLPDAKKRETLVRRRLEFEKDPAAFRLKWKRRQDDLKNRIASARSLLNRVDVPETSLKKAVKLAVDSGAKGHRAEITLIKAARALAAFSEKPEVSERELFIAAEYVLPHRMLSTPFSAPENLMKKLQGLLASEFEDDREDAPPQGASKSLSESLDFAEEPMQVPGGAAAGSMVIDMPGEKKESVIEPDEYFTAEDVDFSERKIRAGLRGGRRKQRIRSRTGRYLRAVRPEKAERDYDVALDASLRAASVRRSMEASPEGSATLITPGDLRKKSRERFAKTLIVFVADASESMGTARRMAACKGAALSLLKSAYTRRDLVAAVSFRNEKAEVVLSPTRSLARARERLRSLPAGGATPFAAGLSEAWRLVKNERAKNPGMEAVLVILSDGDPNVPLEKGRSPVPELLELAARIRKEGVHTVLIDTHPEARSGESVMPRLAEAMDGAYYHAEELCADQVVEAVIRVDSEL